MSIKYELSLLAGTDLYRTVDLSECVSIISRKAYRQGLEWGVAGIRFNSNSSFNVNVATLPLGWQTANAWKQAFRTWRRMQRDAVENQESDAVSAKYLDFKIGFDQLQLDAADPNYAPNLLPFGTAPPAGDAGREWVFSELNFPEDSHMYANQSLLLHMIGDDHGVAGGSVGIIHNYASGRVRPQTFDPNIPESGARNAFDYVFDYGGEASDTLTDLAEQNNVPPYYNGLDLTEEEYYPGGKNYRPDWYSWSISETSVYNSAGGTSSNGFIPGFTALCGLIRFHFLANANTTVKMWIDLMPGPHDGYMARPMQEVN
jgi:hypothetical protein